MEMSLTAQAVSQRAPSSVLCLVFRVCVCLCLCVCLCVRERTGLSLLTVHLQMSLTSAGGLTWLCHVTNLTSSHTPPP